MDNQQNTDYWHANLRLIACLLAIWAFASFGCGILLVDYLNQFRIFGFKLGFWFAQQGAIYTFVVLIFFYVWQMNKLDHQFEVDEDKTDAKLHHETMDENAAKGGAE